MKTLINKRLTEFDFIRCIAILSVIAIHVTGSYSMNSRLIYFWNQSMRYSVPIFVLLSGLVLYYSDLRKENFSCLQFYYKRFTKIVIPYFLWTLIYLLYNNRHEPGSLFKSFSSFLIIIGKALLYGSAHYHLYFIVIILQLYLIYPLLRLLIKKAPVTSLICSFLCSLVFQTIYYLQLFKIKIIPSLPYPYVFLFPVWLFYFVFGMYFISNLTKWQKTIEKKGIIIFAAWLLNLIFVIGENYFTILEGATIKPSVMLYCITSFFFFYWLGLKLKNFHPNIVKITSWLSEQSFLIYFSHPLVLGFLSTCLYFLRLEILYQRFFGKIIIFIVVLSLSSMFSYLLSFTKATFLLGGTLKKNK
jgi:surface polysaccharide O-acyltransferase-like enzyme